VLKKTWQSGNTETFNLLYYSSHGKTLKMFPFSFIEKASKTTVFVNSIPSDIVVEAITLNITTYVAHAFHNPLSEC
jgi:hypothetical protein